MDITTILFSLPSIRSKVLGWVFQHNYLFLYPLYLLFRTIRRESENRGFYFIPVFITYEDWINAGRPGWY